MNKPSSRVLPYSASEALRHKGFVPLPRLWVKAEAIPAIHAIAHVYAEDVRTLRDKVAAINRVLTQDSTVADQAKETEKAWQIHEQNKQVAK